MGQKTGSVQSAGGNRQPSSWCVAVHWNFNCTLWWIRAPPDLGDTAQNGGVKIPRATFVANADSHDIPSLAYRRTLRRYRGLRGVGLRGRGLLFGLLLRVEHQEGA